ncbi:MULTISPECIES: hypothetical protein [unclassified Bradyrhizobium]
MAIDDRNPDIWWWIRRAAEIVGKIGKIAAASSGKSRCGDCKNQQFSLLIVRSVGCSLAIDIGIKWKFARRAPELVRVHEVL